MCGLHPVYIYIWAVFVVAGVAVAVPISLYSKYLFSIIVNICGMHKITHRTWALGFHLANVHVCTQSNYLSQL